MSALRIPVLVTKTQIATTVTVLTAVPVNEDFLGMVEHVQVCILLLIALILSYLYILVQLEKYL